MPIQRVLLTRAEADNSALAEQVNALGFQSVCVPLIRIEFIESAFEPPSVPHDWLFVTSKWTVRAMAAENINPSRFASRIAAIGPGSTKELANLGVAADYVSKGNTLDALVNELNLSKHQRIYYPRSALSDLEHVKAKLHPDVELSAPIIYRNVLPPNASTDLLKALPIDLILVCSSSAAERLGALHAARKSAQDFELLAIGPSTATTCERVQLRVTHVAKPHSVDGLLGTLQTLATQNPHTSN